jgi:hypothetical protein
MMVGFFNLAFSAGVPVEKILPPKNTTAIASR